MGVSASCGGSQVPSEVTFEQSPEGEDASHASSEGEKSSKSRER